MVPIQSTDGHFHNVEPANVKAIIPPAYGSGQSNESLIVLVSGRIIRARLSVNDARARLRSNPYEIALRAYRH